MISRIPVIAVCLMFAAPALALDLPTRKAGLWEIHMEFQGHKNLPIQTMKQCTDAAADKLMTLNFGGAGQHCSKQDINNAGGTITVDSICSFGGTTSTSHAVVTGDFNSDYTVEVTSTREGGRPIPGVPAGQESHMKIAAKWIGACAAGQRPGDVIMSTGMTINVLDMAKRMTPQKP
jgi:hypothetical protein